MYEDLKGKTAIVTGAGKKSGIGYAIARKLAESGCNVIVADLGEQGGDEQQVRTGTTAEMEAIIQELGTEFGVKTLAVSMDVADNGSVEKMATVIGEEFDAVHVLCNNAGASFGVPNTVQNYAEEAWMKTIDINLHGVFRVSRAVLPMMMAKGGVIINTASTAGNNGYPHYADYSASKGGVIALTQAMALELAPVVRVNAISPGYVLTPMQRAEYSDEMLDAVNSKIPMGRHAKPEEIAALFAFLASEDAAFATGHVYVMDGAETTGGLCSQWTHD